MTPGSKNFYEWIVRSHLYYPVKRWEWNQSIHFVKQNSVKTLLDVGCGSGAFLETVKNLKLSSFGIDLDPISVSECKKKGISALAMPIETAAVELKNSFDVITMFHVVEHLADPLNSLKQLSQCLNQSGAIIFSVPNSPMSFEANWIDPLNRPPHHLTRWNKSAILRLADLLGMNCLILSESHFLIAENV